MSLKRILLNDLEDSHGDEIHHFYDLLERDKNRLFSESIAIKSNGQSMTILPAYSPGIAVTSIAIEDPLSDPAAIDSVLNQTQRNLKSASLPTQKGSPESEYIRLATHLNLSSEERQ